MIWHLNTRSGRLSLSKSESPASHPSVTRLFQCGAIESPASRRKMRVLREAVLARGDWPLLYDKLAISDTYSHAKNRNDPRPITLWKMAFLESGFSAVAILGGGWLQSPASDGPPWYPSNYCPRVTWKRSPPMNGRRRYICSVSSHGPLSRYVTLLVEHAPGMPGTFSPPPRVSDPDMHHSTCVTHVSWCMPGSLTSGFLWSRWRGKRSRHSWSMRNPQFYVSGKRPIGWDRSCDDLRATHNNWT